MNTLLPLHIRKTLLQKKCQILQLVRPQLLPIDIMESFMAAATHYLILRYPLSFFIND